jgi:hypothetical protein
MFPPRDAAAHLRVFSASQTALEVHLREAYDDPTGNHLQDRNGRFMAARTERQLLTLLHRRGATRLRNVRFKANRSTIWSLTQDGAVLNLHVAYRTAPLDVLDHFAVIARDAYRETTEYRAAVAAVRTWEGLQLELRRIWREHRRRPRQGKSRTRRSSRAAPCCATHEQTVYLRRLYRYLNRTRFDGRLPDEIPIRLSNRMKTRIGQMVPGIRNGIRHVVEIALNVDLMLEGNGRERIDTLIHEMAHAADWLFRGGLDHGRSWRAWARYAGCKETACADAPIRRRGRNTVSVTRVPRLPEAARAVAA